MSYVGATDLDINGKADIDLAYAKQLIAKYGVALAYQILKKVKTIAQADAEVAAKLAAQAAAKTPGIVNTIVNTVKSNWPLFLIGGLVLFGSGLFKSRR